MDGQGSAEGAGGGPSAYQTAAATPTATPEPSVQLAVLGDQGTGVGAATGEDPAAPGPSLRPGQGVGTPAMRRMTRQTAPGSGLVSGLHLGQRTKKQLARKPTMQSVRCALVTAVSPKPGETLKVVSDFEPVRTYLVATPEGMTDIMECQAKSQAPWCAIRGTPQHAQVLTEILTAMTGEEATYEAFADVVPTQREQSLWTANAQIAANVLGPTQGTNLINIETMWAATGAGEAEPTDPLVISMSTVWRSTCKTLVEAGLSKETAENATDVIVATNGLLVRWGTELMDLQRCGTDEMYYLSEAIVTYHRSVRQLVAEDQYVTQLRQLAIDGPAPVKLHFEAEERAESEDDRGTPSPNEDAQGSRTVPRRIEGAGDTQQTPDETMRDLRAQIAALQAQVMQTMPAHTAEAPRAAMEQVQAIGTAAHETMETGKKSFSLAVTGGRDPGGNDNLSMVHATSEDCQRLRSEMGVRLRVVSQGGVYILYFFGAAHVVQSAVDCVAQMEDLRDVADGRRMGVKIFADTALMQVVAEEYGEQRGMEAFHAQARSQKVPRYSAEQVRASVRNGEGVVLHGPAGRTLRLYGSGGPPVAGRGSPRPAEIGHLSADDADIELQDGGRWQEVRGKRARSRQPRALRAHGAMTHVEPSGGFRYRSIIQTISGSESDEAGFPTRRQRGQQHRRTRGGQPARTPRGRGGRRMGSPGGPGGSDDDDSDEFSDVGRRDDGGGDRGPGGWGRKGGRGRRKQAAGDSSDSSGEEERRKNDARTAARRKQYMDQARMTGDIEKAIVNALSKPNATLTVSPGMQVDVVLPQLTTFHNGLKRLMDTPIMQNAMQPEVQELFDIKGPEIFDKIVQCGVEDMHLKKEWHRQHYECGEVAKRTFELECCVDLDHMMKWFTNKLTLKADWVSAVRALESLNPQGNTETVAMYAQRYRDFHERLVQGGMERVAPLARLVLLFMEKLDPAIKAYVNHFIRNGTKKAGEEILDNEWQCLPEGVDAEEYWTALVKKASEAESEVRESRTQGRYGNGGRALVAQETTNVEAGAHAMQEPVGATGPDNRRGGWGHTGKGRGSQGSASGRGTTWGRGRGGAAAPGPRQLPAADSTIGQQGSLFITTGHSGQRNPPPPPRDEGTSRAPEKRRCWNCGEVGHLARGCLNPPKTDFVLRVSEHGIDNLTPEEVVNVHEQGVPEGDQHTDAESDRVYATLKALSVDMEAVEAAFAAVEGTAA